MPKSSENSIRSVGVYCGSSPGTDPAFTHAACSLGGVLAERGLDLVYGGGHVGLMGSVADSALAAGARVHGVITQALAAKEVAHRGLTTLSVVDTMHERKALIADLADAFIMLPGGFGTLDEFFEVLTWTQLGIHQKPCGLLDVNGFFRPLIDMIDAMTERRFIREEHRSMLLVEESDGALLDRLGAWTPSIVDKWLDRTDR